MNKYIYEGPVKVFDTCVTNNWRGETMAASEAKALSNLKYQYKKQTRRENGTKVDFPGKIKMVS